MQYDKKFENPEIGLEEIYRALSDFCPDVFIYAVKYGAVDREKLILLTDKISAYRLKLEKEYGYLFKFGDNFNKMYATYHNECFNAANQLLNRMKCGIKMTKDLYSLFCPKQNRYAARLYEAYGLPKPSIWDHSYISTTTYSQDLYGIESFDISIQGCYIEMRKFFEVLQKCIKYCQYVLKLEQKVRKDPEYCTYLYNKQREEMMKSVTDLLIGINEINEDIFASNPILQGRKKFGDTMRNIQEWYHRCTPTDMRQALLYDLHNNEDMKNIPIHILKLFKNDTSMIRFAYLIIDNFDIFLEGKQEGQYIGGDLMAMFIYWTGTGNVKNTVAMFNERYKGKYRTIGYTDVYRFFNILKQKAQNGELANDEIYQNFISKANALQVSNTTGNNTIKMRIISPSDATKQIVANY